MDRIPAGWKVGVAAAVNRNRMSQATLFCPGCNAKFSMPAGRLECPQCGQPFASVIDAPTADLGQWDAWGTHIVGEPHPEDIEDDLVGRRLANYTVDAFIGKGGMARVYRAKHLMLERPCALKVLNPQLLSRDTDYLSLFFAEARAAAALVHPNVVTIHSLAQDVGLHLIEMEYVVGQSLQRIVEQERRLEPTRAARIMVQIGAALDIAHSIGIIHRDIKPANVMVTDSGIAKLADFGLAKRVAAGGRTAKSESLAGTPYFMAPELFDGAPADKRSDVYAMGITFFELLTGQLPFVDTSVGRLAERHAMQALPDWESQFPHVPTAAAQVVERCLAKDPAERFADAGELYRELRSIYGNLRTLESLIQESTQDLPCAVEGQGDMYQVHVELPNRRSQRLFISGSNDDTIQEPVVRIYSVCGIAHEAFYGKALQLNAVLPHGSIAIEKVHGEWHFVMSNAYSRATCDASEIGTSIRMIAKYADEVERWLGVEDRH